MIYCKGAVNYVYKIHSSEHIYYTIFSVIYQPDMCFFDEKRTSFFGKRCPLFHLLKVGFKYYFGLHLLYHICPLLSRAYSLKQLYYTDLSDILIGVFCIVLYNHSTVSLEFILGKVECMGVFSITLTNSFTVSLFLS